MNKKTTKMFIAFGLLSLGTSILKAWVFSKLWLWFVAPLGVTKISILQAWGIALITQILFCKDEEYSKFENAIKENSSKINADKLNFEFFKDELLNSICISLSLLAIGFTLHILM